MAENESPATVNRSSGATPGDPEETLVAPRFDRESIREAEPAVPINEVRAGRRWPARLILLCVLAGIAGSVLGGVIAYRYQSGGREGATRSNAVTPEPREADAPVATNVDENLAPSQPMPEATPGATPGATERVEENSSPAATDVAADGAGAGQERSPGEAQAALRGALGEWVAATNARDIQRQMSFYGSTVDAFYLTRNVSRDRVRAEKAQVLGSADVVEVQAAEPSIQLSPDGRTAVMRFRKKYAIGGEGNVRSGEVLQELRWRRTGEGWKIVSERDLRVLR